MLIAAAVAAGCLALLPVTSARGAARAPWATPRSGLAYSPALRLRGPAGQRGLAPWGGLARRGGSAPEAGPAREGALARGARRSRELMAGCEHNLERGQPRTGYRAPELAIVGASFTAGVGPDNPDKSWAVLLAQMLHWNAVVYGDPGAGYVPAGAGGRGPVAAEIARIDLRALAPALVIVQAGHDDIGVPLRLEQQRVEQAVALIHAEAPRARIALLTVFPGRDRSAAAYRTDHAIVTAGTAADRRAIIMDPLTGGWTFPRVRDGLHPTARGSAWIAGKVAGILREHGVLPVTAQHGAAGALTAGALICDSGIRAPAPHR